MKEKFERKYKEEKPVVAICYDFDKTLSPDDMQAQGYIQSVGFDIKDFWKESNELAENNDMDQNLAYMYKMYLEAEGNMVFNRNTLAEYGAKVKLFKVVEEWFERIRDYGKQKNVIVEHYIISSGLKEMIEGTKPAQDGAFTKIYASSFYYSERGVAKWPAQVVNYTNKTQFLFRIEKGVLDINDPGVNDYFQPDKIRVPFRNMVYIGDSDTDIPCMKLVNSYGGYSIGVYNPDSKDKTKVYKMIKDNRIKLFAPADYSDGSEIDRLVKMIIDRTSANEKIENKYAACVNEVLEAEKNDDRDENEQSQDELISCLESSKNFAYTHHIIRGTKKYSKWSDSQKDRLFQALIDNDQIKWILGDNDVYEFYSKLIKEADETRKIVKEVREMLTEIEKNITDKHNNMQ